MEDRDMCRDVEAWRNGALEALCRHAAGTQRWRSGGAL